MQHSNKALEYPNQKGDTMTTKPKFVYDESGNRVEVILAIQDYQAMLEMVEDAEDSAIFDERRHEETIPWETVKAKLMNREQV
jgi:hypothetical protein